MQFLIWAKKHLWLILALVVSLYVGRLLVTSAHFYTHDDLQVFRTNEFIQCFKDGQLPCRWSKNLGKGYGYPYFNFYPPMPYVIPAALVGAFKLPITTALNLAAFLTFPLAAFAMYRLVRVLTNRNDLAAMGSILYTLLPYHAVNIFVRGVYGENLAWSFLPLLFAEVYLVITKKRSILPMTLLGALLLLTHNITALVAAPILILWALSLLFTQSKSSRWSSFLSLSKAVLLAVGLSAFFLLPALFENSLVQSESMIAGYYSYLVHFPSIAQVFFSTFWGYGSSNWAIRDDGMSFALGYVYWVGLLAITAAIFASSRSKVKSLFKNPIVITFSVGAILLLFLTNTRSTPIWELIRPLQYLQFPWRLIGTAGMLIVVLSSYLTSKLPIKLGQGILVLMAAIAILVYSSYFRPNNRLDVQDQDYLTGSLKQTQSTEHVFDYLPKTVKVVPDFVKGAIATSSAQLDVTTYTWNSNTLDFVITQSKEPQNIAVSIFYYPGWRLNLNGQYQNISPDPVSGLITFAIPAGDSRVMLSLQETPLRQVSNLITLISLLILVFAIVSRYVNSKVE